MSLGRDHKAECVSGEGRPSRTWNITDLIADLVSRALRPVTVAQMRRDDHVHLDSLAEPKDALLPPLDHRPVPHDERAVKPLAAKGVEAFILPGRQGLVNLGMILQAVPRTTPGVDAPFVANRDRVAMLDLLRVAALPEHARASGSALWHTAGGTPTLQLQWREERERTHLLGPFDHLDAEIPYSPVRPCACHLFVRTTDKKQASNDQQKASHR